LSRRIEIKFEVRRRRELNLDSILIRLFAKFSRLLISNRPIAEARYQHGTPQDSSGWNFVPKRDLTR
jgi:hypothetical protein